MSGLPRGWVEATVSDLCELINGKAFKPSDWATNGLPIVRIQNLNNSNAGFNYYQGNVEEKFLIGSGQLLFAWSGTPGTSFGAHVWDGGKAVLNQHIFKVNFPIDLVDKHFLRNAINQKLEELIGKAHGGAGLQHVTKGKFEETLVAFPPLAEQKRIVAKLDALNAKSARARTELARIETLVSRYKQAVLSKAFSGELIGSVHSEQVLPTRGVTRLSEICESITDGDHQAPPKATSGVPFITISAMNDGRIDVGKATRFVPRSYYDKLLESRKPRLGDILYSVTGSYGIPAIVKVAEPFVFQRHIAILRPNAVIASAKYIAFLLGSPEITAQADAIATGTAQKTVPLKGLRNFKLPVPPLEEQQEIVRRIESAFAKIDRLAAEAKSALYLVGRLDEAILAKAFRGELVPQDENDEPAEKLLERIRAERVAAPKAKRGLGRR
ncbi:UNVERIFIED_ORG: type I restriction enzyme S subunit [Rhizobium etli]